MRIFVVVALAFGVALPAATGDAFAQQRQSAPLAVPGEEEGRLDELFIELRRARNEPAAERVAERIGREWLRSGSPSVDLMMRWADEAISGRRFDVALDFLDQVVTLAPEFAEGWNRRATVHFMMEDYAKSMVDIERALRLEPRHFGALGGMARIMKQTGRKEMALDAYMRLLEVYPMRRSAQREVDTLAEELAGQGI